MSNIYLCVRTWDTELNREFWRVQSLVSKRQRRVCSKSIASREMKIKPHLSCHHLFVRMAKIKTINDNLCWRRYAVRGSLFHCWFKLVSHCGNIGGHFSKCWLSNCNKPQHNHSCAYNQRIGNHTIWTFDLSTMLTQVHFVMARKWNQTSWPSPENWIRKMWCI